VEHNVFNLYIYNFGTYKNTSRKHKTNVTAGKMKLKRCFIGTNLAFICVRALQNATSVRW
jgi:hypothetical protein